MRVDKVATRAMKGFNLIFCTRCAVARVSVETVDVACLSLRMSLYDLVSRPMIIPSKDRTTLLYSPPPLSPSRDGMA